jgi:ribose transport system substrate-binding protein
VRPAALAALALLASACSGGAEEAAPPTAPDDRYVVGVSNTVLGDDRREELICSVKAEALASGRVQEVLVDNVDGGPDRQAAGIRNLAASGADAIVLVPAHPTEIRAAIEEARWTERSPPGRPTSR